MNKSGLSESDICDKFIRPAMEKAGWSGMEQIFREYPLRAGKVVVRGKKAQRDKSTVLRADYALFYKTNIPLAVVEAKDNNHAVGAGMAQAINYAELLDVPFSFASNGDGFVFRDATLADGVLERNLSLDEFPSPAELWDRYCAWKGWTPEIRQVTEFDYAPSKTPRYYQLNAINRTVEAIARGQNRALLVMATGTGKTYTAFQIIWRLWKSGAKKRILYLADRNILIDQTMVNDFRPFKGAMAKLSPNAKGIERVDGQGQVTMEEVDLAVNKSTKQVDKSYEIYLSLYQAVTGSDDEDNIYKQFSPDFFDLIVVDECHRGSAAEDSAWRDILTYFSSATQIGLTATPKETEDVSNIDYFGEPVYTYSLRQGIEDGYLAPYKVIRVDLDKDTFGWRPTAGMTDKLGHVIEDRVYNAADMNRKLVLERRDEVVATKITEYLKATDRYAKTIVFCEDIDHAARMRQALSNANADTGDALLNFVNNELFTTLKNLNADPVRNPRGYVVRGVFEDAYNYMKSGHLLRQVINKLNGIDFNRQAERHQFNDLYEKILRDLQSAGNAGEFYTPRAVTQFMVDMVNPQLGERVMDPATGTGGFLVCAIEHLRRQVKNSEQEALLQSSIGGVEKKQLPHMLCVTNLMLHGIEVPSQLVHGNTLARPLRDYSPAEKVDVVLTNPPFGGIEEPGIEQGYPADVRTKETADLFLVLIKHILKPSGRAAVVLPDGTLFGEGVKTRIKEQLLTECNLHTIVRLPNGVFAPYTGIKTNLLFFTKGTPTKEVWYYEHPYPAGVKNYNKTKPIRIEEFDAEKAWWGTEADGFASRIENERAWKVSIEQIKAAGYNLDQKNPHVGDVVEHDPEHLLAEYLMRLLFF